VNLSTALTAPSRLRYDHSKGKDQPAQLAIAEIKSNLQKFVPPGYTVKHSGVAHNLPFIAWVAVLDTDQTTTPQSGIYIVYLYCEDMSKLYLSLNQGFTAHQSKAKNVAKFLRKKSLHQMALDSIIADTRTLKKQLVEDISRLKNNVETIDLKSDEKFAEGYMAGHIAGFEYDLANLDSETKILSDLQLLYPIYARACEISDQQSLLNPESWTTTSGDNEYKRSQIFKNKPIKYNEFYPKASTPVKVSLSRHISVSNFRSRKHEKLIEDFVAYVHQFDFKATNNKIGKRDLLIKDSQDIEFLVEAKTVKTDGEEAVRDAIGQLLAYRYEYYEKDYRPELIALFNLKISELWQGLLEELQIEWVFSHNGTWYASKRLNDLFVKRNL